MIWKMMHRDARPEHLGYLVNFLDERDSRPAREQLDANYRHGGGWRPFEGFTMVDSGLAYPGDPVMVLIAEARLRDEIVRFYQHSWVAIVQPDGSYEIARMD